MVHDTTLAYPSLERWALAKEACVLPLIINHWSRISGWIWHSAAKSASFGPGSGSGLVRYHDRYHFVRYSHCTRETNLKEAQLRDRRQSGWRFYCSIIYGNDGVPKPHIEATKRAMKPRDLDREMGWNTGGFQNEVIASSGPSFSASDSRMALCYHSLINSRARRRARKETSGWVAAERLWPVCGAVHSSWKVPISRASISYIEEACFFINFIEQALGIEIAAKAAYYSMVLQIFTMFYCRRCSVVLLKFC